MSRCARCGKKTCVQEPPRDIPRVCPMGTDEAVYEEAIAEYDNEEVRRIALN